MAAGRAQAPLQRYRSALDLPGADDPDAVGRLLLLDSLGTPVVSGGEIEPGLPLDLPVGTGKPGAGSLEVFGKPARAVPKEQRVNDSEVDWTDAQRASHPVREYLSAHDGDRHSTIDGD